MSSIIGGLERYLPEGGTVIDVGANAGEQALKYAKAVGPTGRVIAIEPNPVAMHQAQHALRASPWIEFRQVALDKQPGQRQLHVGRSHQQGSFWEANIPHQQRYATQLVETWTLDAICGHLPAVHGVKIDAQGAELAILEGATQTLLRPETVWMIEVWPAGLHAAGGETEALVNRLRTAGMTVIAEGKTPTERDTLTWDDITRKRRDGLSHTNIICRHT